MNKRVIYFTNPQITFARVFLGTPRLKYINKQLTPYIPYWLKKNKNKNKNRILISLNVDIKLHLHSINF